MSRPQKKRIVAFPPLYHNFKPLGVPSKSLCKICLSLDEFEAIRLADYLDMEHSEAAKEMNISRSTFTRLIEKARKKTATFFINGTSICIEGGPIHFEQNRIQCKKCKSVFIIPIKQKLKFCPECHSEDLLNLAGCFGHGKCCDEERDQQ